MTMLFCLCLWAKDLSWAAWAALNHVLPTLVCSSNAFIPANTEGKLLHITDYAVLYHYQYSVGNLTFSNEMNPVPS